MTQLNQTSKNQSGFYIGVGCPGCGGELKLEEGFFVVACGHCGSVLRVTMPEIPPAYLVSAKVTEREARFTIDRYLKENSLPLTDSGLQFKRIYYPYWKVDAVLLKVRNRIETREHGCDENGQTEYVTEKEKTDISLTPYATTLPAGAEFDGMPFGIGMRTSYLKLVPFSRVNTQDGYEPLPVVKSWPVTAEKLLSRINNLAHLDAAAFGKNRTELFRPVASLIYFPFLVAESYAGGGFSRFVVDAVTGRMLDHVDRFEYSDECDPVDCEQIKYGQLGVDFHRCLNCGEDLPATQSILYVCANCHQLISLEQSDNNIRGVLMTVPAGSETDGLFPFWSLTMTPDVQARLQRLFGGLFRSERLVLPAFRIGNFEAMFRLSKRMSSALPRIETAPVDSFDHRCQPVTLSLAEAKMFAGIITYRAELDRMVGALAQKCDLEVTSADLLYAPFHPESYFYVDSVMGAVTFEKSLIG
jgi:DNA-directed RNA polymerase subunit RPC12/RpoP